jgi:hypothetical protein
MEYWILAAFAAAVLYIALRLVFKHYFPPDTDSEP